MAFTFFFRDLPTLDGIRDHVIPDLKNNQHINIWDAGCAMGPEPYSLAIIFKENLSFYQFKKVRIFATDLDEESHDFGKILKEGIYPEDTVKRIPKDIFKKYFSSNNKPGYFKISDEIMQRVSFQKHDLRSLIPIRDNFGLIVCKNVLLHFSEAERIKVIRMFHKALASGGFFATEQTQKMPKESAHLFKQVKPNIQLFQKTK